MEVKITFQTECVLLLNCFIGGEEFLVQLCDEFPAAL